MHSAVQSYIFRNYWRSWSDAAYILNVLIQFQINYYGDSSFNRTIYFSLNFNGNDRCRLTKLMVNFILTTHIFLGTDFQYSKLLWNVLLNCILTIIFSWNLVFEMGKPTQYLIMIANTISKRCHLNGQNSLPTLVKDE